MNDKAKMNEMTKKYKEEMLRIYNSTSKVTQKPSVTPPKETYVPIVTEPVQVAKVEAKTPAAPVVSTPVVATPLNQKFASPDEILAREITLEAPEVELSQGNYNLSKDIKINEADEILSRALNSGISDDFPEVYEENQEYDSYGYLEVTVKSANNAFPLKDVTVVISSKGKDARILENAQITDENGMIAPVKLKAPNKALSEVPQNEIQPFSEYQVSVYLEDYYPVTKKDVPIFPDTKSVQPFSLVPVAK